MTVDVMTPTMKLLVILLLLCCVSAQVCDPPCANGGTCAVDSTCSCVEGFTGGYCQTVVSSNPLGASCGSNPCMNGATCVDIIDGETASYECQCRPGTGGGLCELCPESECQNGGVCEPVSESEFACVCSLANIYYGTYCEHVSVNGECLASPCENHGVCEELPVDNDADYVCHCEPGTSGTHCELCPENECINEGECTMKEEAYGCVCNEPYEGDYCEILGCGDTCVNYETCVDGECICDKNDIDGLPDYYYVYTPLDCAKCDIVQFNILYNTFYDEDGITPMEEHTECVTECPDGSVVDIDGIYCVDMDECELGTALCSSVGTQACMDDVQTLPWPASWASICPDGPDELYDHVTCVDGWSDDDYAAAYGTVGYWCDCKDGYLGHLCEKEDECWLHTAGDGGTMFVEELCLNGANCVVTDAGDNGELSAPCECLGGYLGERCEQHVCDDQCIYGACYANEGDEGVWTYSCGDCEEGYLHQTEPFESCVADPCLTECTAEQVSICNHDYDSFMGILAICVCNEGFTGADCTEAIDYCADIVCMNEGTCEDGLCVCSTGYDGELCEIDIDECLQTECDQGYCVDHVGFAQCICNDGWEGDLCSQDIDECALSDDTAGETLLCGNGVCDNDPPGTYTCLCFEGWEGDACGVDIDECLEHTEDSPLCLNGGECINWDGSYECVCNSHWTGFHCEEDVNECDFDPPTCSNDGICENLIGGFACECAENFGGQRCNIEFTAEGVQILYPPVISAEEGSLMPVLIPVLGGVNITAMGQNFRSNDSLTLTLLPTTEDAEQDVSTSEDTTWTLFNYGASTDGTMLIMGLPWQNNETAYPEQHYFELRIANTDGIAICPNPDPNAYQCHPDDVLYVVEACPDGQYGVPSDSTCQECPDGLICPGGARAWPDAGYWKPASDESSLSVSECPFPADERCVGGRESSCGEAYTGDYCAECADTFYADAARCLSCTYNEQDINELFFVIFIAVCFFMFFYLAIAFMTDRWLFRFIYSLVGLQQVVEAGRAGSELLPTWAANIFEFLKFVTMDYAFIRPGCTVGKIQYATYYLGILTFVFIFSLLSIPCALLYQYRRRRTPNERWIMDPSKPRIARALTLVMHIAYLQLSIRTMELLNCVPVDGPNGTTYNLKVELGSECWQTDFLGIAQIIGCVVLLTLVTVPLYFARFVYVNMHRGRLGRKTTFFYRWGLFYRNVRHTSRTILYRFSTYGVNLTIAAVVCLFDADMALILCACLFSAHGVFILIMWPMEENPKNIQQMAISLAKLAGMIFAFLLYENWLQVIVWTMVACLLVGLTIPTYIKRAPPIIATNKTDLELESMDFLDMENTTNFRDNRTGSRA